MAKKGTLTVRVVSDTKAAEQGLDRFNTKVSSTGDKLQSAGKKMTMFATVPIAAAMGLAANAASGLQQAVGGTEAVFGDASDEIERYAKTAARDSGLSERAFREATTSIGGQLKRMTGDVDLAAEQSVNLTRVAADLAATYGGTTAEAVDALGAAFRGEADPAERFNLNLKIGAVNAKAVAMGLAESETEVSENAKAQATLALIMEQSADAQGQFARESDSAAGSMQIAKAEMENASAEIGSSLLPHVAKLAGGVADLATKFGELPEPVQNGILALAGVVAVTGPLLSATGKVINTAGSVSDAFETLRLRSMYLKDGLGGAAGLTATMGAVGAAVATGTILYQSYAATKAEARRITELYVDALKSENDELDANVDAVTAAELTNKDYASAIRESGVGFDVLTDAIKNNGDAIESLDDDLPAVQSGMLSLEEALQRAGLEGTAFGDALLTLKGSMSAGDFSDLLNDLDGLSDRYDNATVRTRNQQAAEEDLAGASGEAAGATDDLATSTDGAATAADDAAESEKTLKDAIEGTTNAIRGRLDPLFAAQDALLSHKEAQDAVKQAEWELTAAQQAYDEAVKAHGPNSEEATVAAWALMGAQTAVDDANRKVVRSALDVSTATATLKMKMEESGMKIEEAEAQLRQWVEQGLITEQQAYQTAQELRGTASAADTLDGRNIVIPVSANTSAWERAIADIYARTYPQIRISVGGGGGVPLGNGSRHQGGHVIGQEAYLIGRPGHEELFVPGTSGHIRSGHETDRLRSRSGGGAPAAAAAPTTEVIQVVLPGVGVLAEAIRKHERALR